MDSQNLTIEFIAAISLGVSTSGVDVPLEFVSKPGPEVVKGWLGGVGLGGRPLGNGEAKNPPLSHAECRAEVPRPLKDLLNILSDQKTPIEESEDEMGELRIVCNSPITEL